MLTDLPGISGILVLVAVAPAVVRWWQGRTLKRLADDPALPERLFAARRRNSILLVGAVVLLVAASTRAAWWALPLLVLSSIAASYPLRKALFGETWSLRTYAWFVMRFFIAVWGFWIVLGWTPILAGAAGSLDWLAGIALAALLTAWNARYADIFRFTVRAEPIEEPVLLARFEAMVHTSGIAMPRFERVDLRGGAIANAIALPSLRRSSVIFTQTLLDRLSADETVAVCAHELAHLEHFNPRYLRRINLVNLAVIASGAALVPAARLMGLPSSLLLNGLWGIAVVCAIAWRVRHQQRNETNSDLRAVALCGDPEALVRGLTRLYTIGRFPRRLDAHYERQATHPSLARRIRDIRAATGTVPAALASATSFTGTDGRVVTFETERLHWGEGDAAVHSLSYAYLADLRVQVSGRGPALLVAVERQGRRWELPLAAEDVARAQAVLDIVDARLPAPAAAAAVLWPRINRPVLAFGALLGVALGQVAVALVAFLALLQPAAPLVAAAGIASLAAAGLLLRNAGFAGGAMTELALLLAVFGLVLFFVARSRRKEDIPRRAAISAALLGAFAILSVAALALGGLDVVRLHQSARAGTAAPVLLLAFAGALTLWRSRRAQYAAIPVIVVAAATSVVASTTFLDRFGDDPLLMAASAFEWKSVREQEPIQFSVPYYVTSMQFSPGGRNVALVTGYEDREEQEPLTFHIGRPGGSLTGIKAEDAVFVDDDHILLMHADGDDIEVRLLKVGSFDTVVWRARIAGITRPELSFTAATRAWHVMGWDRRRRIVSAEGRLGEPDIRRTQWAPGSNEDSGWIESMAASGPDAVVVETRYDGGFLGRLGLWQWSWLLPTEPQTRFRSLSESGAADIAISRLHARCFTGALESEELLCSAFDGTRTHFVAVDPVSKRVQGLARLDGRFTATGSSAGGWLTGWRDRSPAALNVCRRQAVQVPSDCNDRIIAVAVWDDRFATVAPDGTGSTIRVYTPD